MDIGPMTPMTEANRLKTIEQDAVEKQKREREIEEKERIRERKENRRWRINEIRAWITLGISLAALAVSIAALFI